MTAQRRVGRTPVACSPRSSDHSEQLARYEGEFLQRGNNHRHAAFECFGKLTRALVDLLNDTALVLELVDRVLKLLVEHHAIGHHDHAVEDPFIAIVMQRRKAVGEPADGVALTAASGVLDQIVSARRRRVAPRPPASGLRRCWW